MKEITYHKEVDYLIPDLIMENSNEDYHIGKIFVKSSELGKGTTFRVELHK